MNMLNSIYCESYYKHEKELREAIEKAEKAWDFNYCKIVSLLVEHVINKVSDNCDRYCADKAGIHVIDDGDYQGSLIFAIPKLTYQPAPYEYIFAYTYYGSCSGCDALEAACGDIDELMLIALDIFESMKFLWDADED